MTNAKKRTLIRLNIKNFTKSASLYQKVYLNVQNSVGYETLCIFQKVVWFKQKKMKAKGVQYKLLWE